MENQMGSSGASLTVEERRILFDQFLRCLDREENLIHYRLSWGLQWNVASFAGLFALQQLTLENRSRFIIYIIIAVFGMIATGLSMIGIWAAHEQTGFLIKSVNTRLKVEQHNWKHTEFIRPYGDPSTIHRRARWASKFLPGLFILLWIAVFMWAFKAV